MNQIDIIQQFNDAMRSDGINPVRTVIGTGKIERFQLDTDNPGEKSGWAVLHLDAIPAGVYGNWKTQESHKWCSQDRSRLAPQEKSRVNKLLAQAEATRNAELIRIQKAAAVKATTILADATPIKSHAYLTEKQIGPYGARLSGTDLVIEVRDADGITSLQRIASDGTKRFMPNGRVAGCFHLFGVPEGITYITEGWATGATIHHLTGRPVVVAFNAGNLAPVARAVATKWPVIYIVAADNDQWGVRNAGVESAKATGLPMLIPTFPASETKPTDFNDLARIDEDQARVQLVPPTGLTPPAVIHHQDELPEQWIALPDVRGEKSRPISSLDNLREILRRLGIIVRYNCITKEEEILIPGTAFSMDNKANASLAVIESRCAQYGMPTDKVLSFLLHLADENQYNPVATWIESKPWDGVSRLPDLYKTIKVMDEEIDELFAKHKRTILKRWMVSAVAAAFRPDGISSQGVLVLQGAQALGKTSWFKRLCPKEMRSEGVTLRLDDKDSILGCISYWIVELGELDATFRKSDIAQLKSFITRKHDVVRIPYAKRKSEYPRRTVFFASVNGQEFLHDETGNRRFWTLPCEWIDYMHKIDMQQLWAEVLTLYKSGEPWILSHDELELTNVYNRTFEVLDPADELISAYDWTQPVNEWVEKTATEIMKQLGESSSNNRMLQRVGAAIKARNGGLSRRSNGRKLHMVPSKII